jgi:hypothetical protein
MTIIDDHKRQGGYMRRKLRMPIIIVVMFSLAGCVAWNIGVKPVDPPGKMVMPPPVVNSLNPTLTWEPSELEKSSEVEDLHYHLVVLKLEGGFFSKMIIVYEKNDMRGITYTFETPLEPHTRYFWRIRPIYKQGGKEITGDWNGFSYIYLTPIVWGWAFGNPYFFETPE